MIEKIMKIKSPISELIEAIILIVAGVAAGVLVWDSVAFGIWLGMIGMCVKIIVTCTTMAVDLLILAVKRLDIIIERGDIK
jgi:hypothetical protein